MRGINKKAFLAVQLVAVAVAWLLYRSTHHAFAPSAMVWAAMQVNALGISHWIQNAKRKPAVSTSVFIN
jgi:hypothetical protein